MLTQQGIWPESYKPAKKPQLTFQMKKKRLEFSKKHINWSIEDWKKVLFSDESTFQQFIVRKIMSADPWEKDLMKNTPSPL